MYIILANRNTISDVIPTQIVVSYYDAVYCEKTAYNNITGLQFKYKYYRDSSNPLSHANLLSKNNLQHQQH